jgi:hypothetical protein
MTILCVIWIACGLFTTGLVAEPGNWVWELLFLPLWPVSLGYWIQLRLNKNKS